VLKFLALNHMTGNPKLVDVTALKERTCFLNTLKTVITLLSLMLSCCCVEVDTIMHFDVCQVSKVKVKLSLCLTKYHAMKMYPLLN